MNGYEPSVYIGIKRNVGPGFCRNCPGCYRPGLISGVGQGGPVGGESAAKFGANYKNYPSCRANEIYLADLAPSCTYNFFPKSVDSVIFYRLIL